MYSALKVNGKKLYELARAGKEIERQARLVEILDIQIEKIDLPRVTFHVSCSKGTYIRTLCYDIGRKLGCGGCMESLLRTRVDRFCLEDSLTLSQIEALRDEGRVEEHVLPVDSVFLDYPKFCRSGERAISWYITEIHFGRMKRFSQWKAAFALGQRLVPEQSLALRRRLAKETTAV